MKKLLTAFTLMLFAVGFTYAQTTISGTVTDDSGEPLIGTSILVEGTITGTVTDIDGKYTLNVPEGSNVLVFSYTGYKSQRVEINGRTTIDVVMETDAIYTEEVVVTGLGIKREKKALGFGVTTVGSADIELRSEADVARILRGKAPGVDITQTSGIAGSGTNIIIRGYSSITGSNQPLFVVDGVPFNTSTNNDQNFVGGGATASSRFLDLDPNNIAEISILKGLSATVLYGEAGRNGVVLVTTKTGQAAEDVDKGFEVRFMQQFANTEVANLPDYQNTYGNGFSGNFGWFFSNWGPAFDVRGSNGIAEDGTVSHPYDRDRYAGDFPEFQGVRYPYQPYESVENYFQTGLVSNTSVGIDKSFGEDGGFSANYSYLDDEGFTPGNTYAKHNLGVGGRANLANGLRVNGTINVVSSDRTAPPASVGFGSNPSGASAFGNLLYTPRSIDLLNLPFQSPVDGRSIYYRSGNDIQNPLWTLANANDFEKIRRFFGNLQLSYDITDWLSVTYRGGVDQYSQQNRRSINRGGTQVPDGQLASSTRLNTITDQVLNIQYDTRIGENLELNGVVGANFRRETNDRNFLTSTNQFVFGLLNHGNFIDHNNSSFLTEENTLGAYATATLGYKNFLYVNLQGRNDWTSTLEEENRSIFYPSASVSFVPTDAFSGLENSQVVNYLKLRLGYGTSAGYPDPYQTRTILGTGTRAYATRGGALLNVNTLSNNLGNPNLQPELITELEFGLEGRFFNNRFGVDLSLYDKDSDDLIIDLNLDPSTGFTNTTVNAASVQNQGIELGLNFVPFRGDFGWDFTLNFTRNINTVQQVAEGVDEIVYAGYTNLGNFAIPGESFGTMKGLPFERNAEGQLVTTNAGDYIPANDIGVIGDAIPDFNANWLNTFSYKGLSLYFQWSWTQGGDIMSLTTATMLARGTTTDTDVDRFLPIILNGVNQSDGTPNDVQGYMGDLFFNAYFFADEGAVFDATVVRLREVSLSYKLPQGILKNTPFGSASIVFSGENMWYNAPNFPEGVNFDPEVLSLGVGNGRGFEYLTGPTAKKYGVALNVTF